MTTLSRTYPRLVAGGQLSHSLNHCAQGAQYTNFLGTSKLKSANLQKGWRISRKKDGPGRDVEAGESASVGVHQAPVSWRLSGSPDEPKGVLGVLLFAFL